MGKGGLYALVSAFFQGSYSSLFTNAILLTSTAHVLILASANPLWAALLEWAVLGEKPRRHTWIAIGIAIPCLVAVPIGTLVAGDSAHVSILGDTLAFLSSLCLSGWLVVGRYVAIHRPSIDLVPSSTISFLVTMMWGLVMAHGNVAMGVRDNCVVKSGIEGLVWVALDGAVVMSIAMMLWQVSMKYIVPAEVALIQLLEVPLGPLWVWVALDEAPDIYSLVGGIVFLVTLIWHIWKQHMLTQECTVKSSTLKSAMLS